MRSHILRAISEGDLDPKKAHVASKGKLVQKKPSASQTAEVKDEEVVTNVTVDMSTEEALQHVDQYQPVIETNSDQTINSEPLFVETVQEPTAEKKKSTFFKKKNLTSA